jgi:hypothetical protein
MTKAQAAKVLLGFIHGQDDGLSVAASVTQVMRAKALIGSGLSVAQLQALAEGAK